MALRWLGMTRREASMTIQTDSVYRTYTKDQDPSAIFDKVTGFLQALRGGQRSQHQNEVLIKEIHILGSNRIENAGLGLDVTLHLCRKILRREPVENIDERTPDYVEKLIELTCLDVTLEDKAPQYILWGRREIFQHAKEFQHIIDRFFVRKEDMTEDLIKEAHGILCKGVSIID